MFAHAQIPYRPSVRLSVHGSVHPCVRAGVVSTSTIHLRTGGFNKYLYGQVVVSKYL